MISGNDGRRKAAATLLALAALCAGAARARALTPTAGVVISVEGKPLARRAGAKSFRPVKVNDMLHEGDEVKTGRGSRVGIAFIGGAELRINENSVFTVRNGGGSRPTSVFTRLGEAWARLISGAAQIEVRTPEAVCAVRGTEADVSAGGGPMLVKVYEGHVDLMNSKGRTALHAGQMSSVAGAGQAPRPASAMSPQDYGTWQNGLKAADLSKSLKLLDAAAVKTRSLELKMKDKDGKTKSIRLNFEKK
jgi:ferric-dicitrate binding protein FerR (iron transport regulator)